MAGGAARTHDRPAPLNGALRGPTYCDGDSWFKGCGSCASCGGPIARNESTGRLRSEWFCAQKVCRRWWRENHQWREARDAALRRDRRCASCHRGDALRQLRQRRGAARLSAGPHAQTQKNEVRLEVNHKNALADSVVGSGAYETSCEHHQDGLTTLCRDCHQEETTRQLRERRVRRGLARTEAMTA